MVARFTGATLGLFAFTITITAGLLAQNPVAVTLSRSLLALFVFCVVGLLLGSAAQKVIAEHERQRESDPAQAQPVTDRRDSAGREVGR